MSGQQRDQIREAVDRHLAVMVDRGSFSSLSAKTEALDAFGQWHGAGSLHDCLVPKIRRFDQRDEPRGDCVRMAYMLQRELDNEGIKAELVAFAPTRTHPTPPEYNTVALLVPLSIGGIKVGLLADPALGWRSCVDLMETAFDVPGPPGQTFSWLPDNRIEAKRDGAAIYHVPLQPISNPHAAITVPMAVLEPKAVARRENDAYVSGGHVDAWSSTSTRAHSLPRPFVLLVRDRSCCSMSALVRRACKFRLELSRTQRGMFEQTAEPLGICTMPRWGRSSQECSACGHRSPEKRKSQAQFC